MTARHQVFFQLHNSRCSILRMNRSLMLLRDLALSHRLRCCISRALMFVSACHVWAGNRFPLSLLREESRRVYEKNPIRKLVAKLNSAWLTCELLCVRHSSPARCCRVNTLTSKRERMKRKMCAACDAIEYYYPAKANLLDGLVFHLKKVDL